MKWILTVLVILLVAVGALSIATGYTRDVSGSDSKAILVALEALIDEGVGVGGVDSATFHAQLTDADASDEGVIKTATAAKKMYILTLSISCDTALDVTIEDSADTVYEVFYCAAKGGAVKEYHPSTPLIIATNKALQVQTDTSGNISVAVTGYLAE